jgi:hypothetical protein
VKDGFGLVGPDRRATGDGSVDGLLDRRRRGAAALLCLGEHLPFGGKQLGGRVARPTQLVLAHVHRLGQVQRPVGGLLEVADRSAAAGAFGELPQDLAARESRRPRRQLVQVGLAPDLLKSSRSSPLR